MEKILFTDNNIDLKRIEKHLKNGETIVYPTDTVYGIGASIDSLIGLKNIYKVKERDFKSPLIALVSQVKYIDKIAILDNDKKEYVKQLAKQFWPGGLTIILKRKSSVPDLMVSNGETIGVRIPNLKLALDIIEAVGGILPTTSANISGEATPKSFCEISDRFKSRVNILVDAGKSPIGIASTILDMTCDKPKILREGAISKEDIEKIIGKI